MLMSFRDQTSLPSRGISLAKAKLRVGGGPRDLGLTGPSLSLAPARLEESTARLAPEYSFPHFASAFSYFLTLHSTFHSKNIKSSDGS